MNIIELIKADHRHVESLFKQWKAETEGATKHDILRAILRDLDIHMRMEESIVYPEYREIDPEHAEHAEEEHRTVRSIMGQVDSGPAPALATFVAKLEHEVTHHVQEEEKVGDGMLSKLAESDLDLDALGLAAEEFKNNG